MTEFEVSLPDWYAHDSCCDSCFSENSNYATLFLCDSRVIDKIRPFFTFITSLLLVPCKTSKTGSLYDVTMTTLTLLGTLHRTVLPEISRLWTTCSRCYSPSIL